MRFPKYISPSSLALFKQNREKYFIKYMSGMPNNNVQTRPMAVGSGFDALVKDQLSRDLGLGPMDLFEEQVDKELLSWARHHAGIVYDQYYKCGAYKELLAQMEKSVITPQFEFELTRKVDGVPIKGYPDVFFMTEQGLAVIVDFKVNGYCSASGVKPKQTFIKAWPPQTTKKVVTRTNYKGITINAGQYFETVDKSWCNQMTMYAWMLGYMTNFVISIEQLAWKDGRMIVARHAGRVGEKYSAQLLVDVKDMWAIVCSGHVCENQERILKQVDDPMYRLLLS